MITQAAFALLQSAKDIRVALVAAGLRIADLLTEQNPPPIVDGEPLFCYHKQVQHLIHELKTSEGSVLAAEEAHMKQEVRVSRLRTERNEKVKENYDKLVAARQGLDGLQGAKGGFETVYVSGTAPKQPDRLLEQLAQSVTLLNDPAVEPRKLKIAGFSVDYSLVAEDLETGRVDLLGIIERLDSEVKLAEGTMLTRRETIEGLKSTVIWAGRSAEGLFHRAGEDELAKRIRSSTSRPQRPSEKAAQEKADGEASTDDSPADDPTTGEPASEPVAGSAESASSDS